MGILKKDRMFTSMVDLNEYAHTNWVFVANIKTEEEYAGIANAFRHAGIDYSMQDKGSLKDNFFLIGLFTRKKDNKNYGMDIFVPQKKVVKAKKILADEALLAEAAERQQYEQDEYQKQFEEDVRRYHETAYELHDDRSDLGKKVGVPARPYSKPTGRIIRDASEKAPTKTELKVEAERAEKQKKVQKMERIITIIFAAFCLLTLAITHFAL